MGSERRQRIEPGQGVSHQAEKHDYPPKKFKQYLACPFPKHNPGLHETVNNVCTRRWGFEDITTLNYHIRRVHSPQFGCSICKTRFTQSNKDTIEEAKRNHVCKPRAFTNEDAQWMTEEQESRLSAWKELRKAQDGKAESWAKIYSCLFPDEDVPSPYYDYLVPRHLAALSSMEDTHIPTTQRYDTDASSIQTHPSQAHPSQAQGIESEELSEEQRGPQLEYNPLGTYADPYGNEFDWSVTPALDSAYGSGSAGQEPDASSSQDQSVAPGQYLLRREDMRAAFQYIGGISEQAGTDYGDLNLEENE